MDDDLRLVRPICLEPGHAPLPQLHELRPDLVRGCRVGGFERPHALGARRHRARRAAMPSIATGRCDCSTRPRSIALDLGQPARAGVRDARRGGDAGGASRASAGAQRSSTRFSDDLLALLDEARRPEWEWFEIVLAYDNARLPEALIRAGQALGPRGSDRLRPRRRSTGSSRKQTSPEGRFRAVGTESFGRPYAEPLPFDQQPLEAQATVDACAAAFEATGDARWRDEAERAYRWYLGAERPRSAAGDRAGRRLFRRADADRAQPQSGRRVDFGAATGQLRDFRALQSGRKAWQGRTAPSRSIDSRRRLDDSTSEAIIVDRSVHASPAAACRSVARRGAAVPYRAGRRQRRSPSRTERLVGEVLAHVGRRRRATQLEIVLKDFEARHWQTRRVFMTRYDEIEDMLGPRRRARSATRSAS